MRLLPHSATGQTISNYVSLLTENPARGGSSEQAQEKTVFILVDNGRARIAGSAYQDMLRCIRCGACMNHCPVYFSLGGHAYGWVYPGPMGSVLTRCTPASRTPWICRMLPPAAGPSASASVRYAFRCPS